MAKDEKGLQPIAEILSAIIKRWRMVQTDW